jgi:hypothetical protein
MNLKNSFENAKRKIKDNAPIILASAVAVGSAAVVYTMTRKLSIQIDAAYPSKGDFSLSLSGREFDRLKSGIPRTTGLEDEGVEIMIATRDMLKDEALERISQVLQGV